MSLPLPLSIPYPLHPHPRPYGPITANTNFCETDHLFSRPIAELINTLSNLTYILYALHGLRQLHRRRSLTFQTALPHVGILCVGASSAWYHATLLKGPQLADELSMALPTGAVFSRLVASHFEHPRTKSGAYWASVAVIVGVYGAHLFFFLNFIHYPAFGGMVFYVGRRCIWLINRIIPDEGVRRKVRRQTRVGEVLFLGAFALWLVDRFCCEWLRGLRARIGLPWGFATELHGWWHVGTAMGAYTFVQVAEYVLDVQAGVYHGDPGTRLSPFHLKLWGSEPAAKDEKSGTIDTRNGAVNKVKKR